MKTSSGLFQLLLTAVILPLFFGCQKGITDNQTGSLLSTGKKSSTATPLGSTPDVYVCGSDGGAAVYWKNGVEYTLPGGTQANAIVAVGGNVYVCGWGYSPTTGLYVAQYWLNGVLTNLSDGTNFVVATGIAVSGSDVYIAGTIGMFVHTGVYWKNGVATSLGSGQPSGIFISPAGDIYIPNVATGGPTYWKNGTLVTITGASTQTLNAIAVDASNNVYAVGWDDAGVSGMASRKALYWLNGTVQTSLTTSNLSIAYTIALSNTTPAQAYISGISTNGSNLGNMVISYWTGETGDLNTLGTEPFEGLNTGITVDQSSGYIYVCGGQENSSLTGIQAMYWQITSPGGSYVSVPLSSTSTDAVALCITLGQ